MANSIDAVAENADFLPVSGDILSTTVAEADNTSLNDPVADLEVKKTTSDSPVVSAPTAENTELDQALVAQVSTTIPEVEQPDWGNEPSNAEDEQTPESKEQVEQELEPSEPAEGLPSDTAAIPTIESTEMTPEQATEATVLEDSGDVHSQILSEVAIAPVESTEATPELASEATIVEDTEGEPSEITSETQIGATDIPDNATHAEPASNSQPLFGSSPIRDELSVVSSRDTSVDSEFASEIPVDKLTTSASASFPAARLSSMRSFSRIPETPSPTRSVEPAAYPASDAFVETTDSLEQVEPEPEEYQELPPELAAMADRFIESIKEITSASNLSPEKLSELFQDFYVTVQEKATTLLRRNTLRRTYEVQMMSFEEISRKKRERKQKEAQKLLYEELVEKKVCEACYNEIFMFQGSDDEAKDSTLATKIAALKLINIGMEHLGVPELKDRNIGPLLDRAGDELKKMADKHSPKAKLGLLISAHKQIVDVLSKLTQANGLDGQSGADFVLPTLIYSVIQADPPHISSNLAFIQRFRMAKSINGETAYCLTNFEAVVAFLETVDLATLKLDQSEIAAPIVRPVVSAIIPNPLASPVASPATESAPSLSATKSELYVPPTTKQSRPPTRTSSLQPSRTPPIPQPVVDNGMASPDRADARRRSFYPTEIAASAVTTADHGIKSLGSTFESSYKFLFGGRGGSPTSQNAQKPVQMKGTANVEALQRRTQEVLENSNALISAHAEGLRRESIGVSPPPYPGPPESVASVPLPRAGLSVNRSRAASSSSSLFPDVANESPTLPPSGSSSSSLKRIGTNESVLSNRVVSDEGEGSRPRSLFSNMRNFGRSGAAQSKELPIDPEAVKNIPKIARPPQKFIGLERSSQLKLGDVDELLADYKRLIDYLSSISAFED